MINYYNLDYSCAIKINKEDIILDERFCDSGYANLSNDDKRAVDLFAKYEGILLDPVYSGRAAAGMIKMIENGEIDKNSKILFIHTGGTPTLFTDLYRL
jgi:1-aminocyclopropane-1-carboxylate deaminase/D-cysteine desulfhydrase-like pyridoxal-dependent ACC family enzyme